MKVVDRLANVSLRARKASARRRVEAANRFLPARYECPCCGWTGRRFASYIQPSRDASLANEECPQCGSHRRHRAFALWLRAEYGLETRRGVALLFAPERCLHSVWDAAPRLSTFGVDLGGHRSIDVRADLRALPIETGSVDLVWCHHVLEHIEDDRAAMTELARVLKRTDGELIFSVPSRPGPTVEHGFPDPRDNGHWRVYGRDDVERLLRDAGLNVETIKFDLDPALVRRHHTGRPRFYRCVRAS